MGWNRSNWEGLESVYPASYHKSWHELTPEEQQTAEELNYGENNWNSLSLSDAIRSGNIIYTYWNKFRWDQLSPSLQNFWGILGWNSVSWNGSESAYPESEHKAWTELTLEEQQAAKELDYSESTWNK